MIISLVPQIIIRYHIRTPYYVYFLSNDVCIQITTNTYLSLRLKYNYYLMFKIKYRNLYYCSH